jgi:thiamine-phosphate pyrophosphorylase
MAFIMSPAKKTPRQVLRIVDANLNRAAEGLRLLEDIARLMLDDSVLTQQLKNMRHELVTGSSSFQQALLRSRDSADDVGVDMEVPGEGKERELSLVLVANSRRVQESLRTLEELSKLPEVASELDSEKFKQARFDLYTIEKKLMSGLLRKDKAEE